MRGRRAPPDRLSAGRLTLGLGAGGTGWDATMLAEAPWSPAERAARFNEFVDVLDRVLREPAVTWTGRYYSAQEVRSHPGCVQTPRVPFAVAATGPLGMRVAAEHAAIWVTNGDRGHAGPPLPPSQRAAVVARQIERLEQACQAVGRDAASLDKLVLTGPRLDPCLQSVRAFRDAADSYAAVGVSDLVVHWPRPNDPYAGDPSILEHIAGVGTS